MATIDVEDRRAMREGFARLLLEKCAESDVRRVMAEDAGHDSALWRAMAEMGITGVLVPEAYGGLGGGALEIEAIMEEAGAALLAGPLVPSAVLVAGLLAASSDEALKERLLPDIAAGTLIGTAALTGDTGTWTPDGVDVVATRSGEGWSLDGSASFVACASLAGLLIVVARTPAGLAGFEVSPQATGLAVSPLKTWDPTLRLTRLTFDGVEARSIAGLDEAAIERALDFARVALAGEQAGAARRIYEITLDYLKTRVQFGRPIGGFQAMKHMAADLLIEVESATSAARAAAAALDAGAPDKDVLVNLAAFACADAFVAVAAAAIQMHGGIAFTWEHPAHLYWRRANADEHLLGNSNLYRERYLAAMEKAA